MAALPVEERVAVLEREVAQLKKRLGSPPAPAASWWEQITGTFTDDPVFEEAMRLGREYRAAQRSRSPRRRKR